MFNFIKKIFTKNPEDNAKVKLRERILKEVEERVEKELFEENAKKTLIGKHLDYEYLETLFQKVQKNSDVHVIVRMQNGESIEICHGANSTIRKQSIYDIPNIKENLILVGDE